MVRREEGNRVRENLSGLIVMEEVILAMESLVKIVVGWKPWCKEQEEDEW